MGRINKLMDLDQAMRSAERIIKDKFSLSLKEFNITNMQFLVLRTLYIIGEMSIQDLMYMISSTKGNMTVVIRNMIDNQLVYKNQSKKDKRISIISLTDKGEDLIKSMMSLHDQILLDLYKELDDKDIDRLINLLYKIK